MTSAWTILLYFCTIYIPLCIGGLIVDKRRNKEVSQKMLLRRGALNSIAKRYNAVTTMLERQYNGEIQSLGRFASTQKEQKRRQYEQLYLQNKAAYESERKAYIAANRETVPRSFKAMKRYWQIVIASGLIIQFAACTFSIGDTGSETAGSSPVQATETENRFWNAENIPMPHLQDASRYMSNPDNIVSPETELRINVILKMLDDSLQIETAMVIVNHIENDDPYRMAQDIGNKYGVGKQDRGLVVVVGYLDHSINMSTGRSLEADLTDVECRRLQQEYLIPSMKAEQPDSGMLYLSEAIYCKLKEKDMPVLQLSESAEDDGWLLLPAIYMFLFGGWMILIAYLTSRYSWTSGRNMFYGNPFQKEAEVYFTSGGFGGSGSGRGFGGGGFSGGSFGGGSFGGGGATSRW